MDASEKLLKIKIKKEQLLKSHVTAFSFLAPNIIGFLSFTLLPVLASFILAFSEWDILTPPKFVGIGNFITLLQDKLFWKYFFNTVFFMLGIPFGMAVSLSLALLMNNKIKGVVVFRTVYFLPVVSSMVAVALLWRWIYNPDFGLLNSFLRWVGLNNPPQWLSSKIWAKPAIMIMWIWKGAGYNMLLYLAALQGIPHELYEAASIDGASAWQRFWHITFPMLGPANFFIVIMGIIGGFQAFGEIYVMTGGGPAGSTTTIVYYIYNNAFQWFKMGYASSIAWFLFLIIFVATLLQWKYAGQKVDYNVT